MEKEQFKELVETVINRKIPQLEWYNRNYKCEFDDEYKSIYITPEPRGDAFLSCRPQNWIFSQCTDEEAIKLMNVWISKNIKKQSKLKFDFTWEFSCQFCRLICEKGYLIKDTLNDILQLDVIDKHPWGSYGMLCSGILWTDNGKEKAIKLLDIVQNDDRDGIFTAIWKSDDMELNTKLLEKFELLVSEDKHYGSGTGERHFLESFMVKWITKNMFTVDRLKKLITYNCNYIYDLCMH